MFLNKQIRFFVGHAAYFNVIVANKTSKSRCDQDLVGRPDVSIHPSESIRRILHRFKIIKHE